MQIYAIIKIKGKENHIMRSEMLKNKAQNIEFGEEGVTQKYVHSKIYGKYITAMIFGDIKINSS